MYICMDKLRQYERVLNHFDSDGDGKLSPAELQLCVAAMGGELSLEEAKAGVEMLDSDGDGLADLDDLVSFSEGGEEEARVNDLKEAFQMYEMDGNGSGSGSCITPTSLKRMLTKLGLSRTTIDDCKTMIARFDLNGDGVLCFHEFRIMMQ